MRVVFFLFASFFCVSGALAASLRPAVSDSAKRAARHKPPVADTSRHILHVNRIFIVGNRITRDRIVLRELSLKPGDTVSTAMLPLVIERDKRKLINTRLFNTVEIKPLEYESDHIDLLIDINERWYTFPSPIFELSDRNFNEWWQNYNHDFNRVNYGLRLYQYNMRGRNETLRLTAQFGYQRKFDITYRFPYIDRRQRQGLIINADFNETKNLAYKTADHKLVFAEADQILKTTSGGGITYTYRGSFYDTHAIRVEYRSSTIADTIQYLTPNYFTNELKKQRFAILGYQFTSDHRDYIGYPLRGYHFTAGLVKVGFSKHDDVKKFELNASYSHFIEFKRNYFLSNNSLVFWSTPQNLAYANYSALGYGRQYVRGYELYIIEGPWHLVNKTTFKKRIFSKVYNLNAMPIRQFRYLPLSIYIKTYADLGYVKNYPNYTNSMRLTDKVISGAGAGLDIVASYDSVFRLEYTFNGEGDHGFFFNFRREF
ncbi:hypothetical protein JI741_08870 [Chryseolinea sp. Jin1]|uniref:POTRA domain-containing protein n=1 Tax=Chryseolinea lacunae TaxID=2801331 RepID=A0ABS1KPI0_9BACT|nr:hypothetical protein [Chryseolinea lacunae]